MRYIVPKGSVAVAGVSLTVIDAGPDWFTVSLVRYTLRHTNLGETVKGGRVNIETDVIGKYVEKFSR